MTRYNAEQRNLLAQLPELVQDTLERYRSEPVKLHRAMLRVLDTFGTKLALCSDAACAARRGARREPSLFQGD